MRNILIAILLSFTLLTPASAYISPSVPCESLLDLISKVYEKGVKAQRAAWECGDVTRYDCTIEYYEWNMWSVFYLSVNETYRNSCSELEV